MPDGSPIRVPASRGGLRLPASSPGGRVRGFVLALGFSDRSIWASTTSGVMRFPLLKPPNLHAIARVLAERLPVPSIALWACGQASPLRHPLWQLKGMQSNFPPASRGVSATPASRTSLERALPMGYVGPPARAFSGAGPLRRASAYSAA